MSANHAKVRIRLEPLAIEVEIPRGSSLLAGLADHGVEFPCGGTALCGGCGVRVLAGSLDLTGPDRAVFTPDQLADGWRLACQARAQEQLVLECGQWRMNVLTDDACLAPAGKHGLAIAIDLGTTTIAAQMIDLASGSVLAVETGLNPQAVHGSDVMSRILAVLNGADLTTGIRAALGLTIDRLARGRQPEIAEVILVGNTVMHHLFSGLSVEPLAHVPFESPHLAEQRFTARQLGWNLSDTCIIRFARCLGGFVGADILAGIVATGIARGDGLVALVDLGTNGEIAIGNRSGVVCASTAAGPAFEAGSIRMGMRAVTGAISHVALLDRSLRSTVIGDVEPRGIYQADIRELQLAKAAIAAGFRLLLNRISAGASDLQAVHLAGAFGNYVQIESANRIGLIEAPRERVESAGNTALRGAKMLLLAGKDPALPPIEHVSLAALPEFQDEFARCMTFPS